MSREQVYRLVTGVPERLSLAVAGAALCDILSCQPGDLIEVAPRAAAVEAAPGRGGAGAAQAGPGPGDCRSPDTVSGLLPSRP